MRIITESWLRDMAKKFPKAVGYLATWRKVVMAARWATIVDVRKDYPKTDAVTVKSGKTVYVFNVCGNTYRMIAAIHFDKQRVFTLRLMTHAEYDKNDWKNEL